MLKLFLKSFFFITDSCCPPDSNFTMHKCTSVQHSQILDKHLLLAFNGSKVILAFYVAHFAIQLFSPSYFDHSIQKQPKTAEHFILYTLCNMKYAFLSIFLSIFDQK